VLLQADYTYVTHVGGIDQAYLKMTIHLQSIIPIFKETDFDNDGNPEGI